jgi:hypothetical protein
MSTIFISYSHVDAAITEALDSLLDDLKIDYFRDVKNIDWGDPITVKVREALDACIAILVVLSPASIKSVWVPFEIGYASALRKTILPFLTHPSLEVPHYLRDYTHLSSIEKAREYFENRFAAEVLMSHNPANTSPSQQGNLTDEQVDYLLEISKPRNEGFIPSFIDEQTGREVAPYQEALQAFQGYGLMEYSKKGYRITCTGWRLVDQLWALRVLDSLDQDKSITDKDIALSVGLTDGQSELDEVHRHIGTLEKKCFVTVSRIREEWGIRILESGITERKHRALSV